MRRSLTVAGLLLLLLPLLARAASGAASSASSAPATLYDRIKNEVDNELTQRAVEPEVRTFIRNVINKQYNLQLSDSDIDTLAQGQMTQTCGNVELCQSVMQDVERIVGDEERVRSLGRDLQLTATSNELPVANLPGRSLQLSRDMQGIVNIWSADNYASSSSASSVSSLSSASSASAASSRQTMPLRTVEVDPGDAIVNRQTMQPLLEQLGNALNDLSSEQRIAAVWRYQYGVRLVQGARQPEYPPPYVDDQSGDGTERQYLFKRQAAVEEALMAIWNVIVNDTFNPPLQQNETALYEFPTDLMKDSLPDNVIVWARMDLTGKNKNHPLGDVGLQWTTPLEPVLPSLTSVTDDSPILGGNYPPQPVIPAAAGSTSSSQPLDGRGLCTDPTQSRGYLCRRYIVTGGANPCLNSSASSGASSADPTAITLVTCQQPSPYYPTIAGPDVCRDLSFQTPKPFDPKTQCKLQIDCTTGTSCPGLPQGYAETFPKDSKGVIRICIPEQSDADYVLFHELHHAYQICNQPPNAHANDANFKGYVGIPGNKNTLCCEMEGEAYRAQCNLMEKDGLFKNVAPIDGIPVNAETCAEVLTDDECFSRGIGHCPVSRTYSQKFIDAATGTQDILPPNPVAPGKCSQISTVVDGQKEYKDPRVQALIDKIRGMNPVSTPGTTANFTNKIGNVMCYVGQAVEESAEQKRVTGARTPATTGDQSFPYHSPLTGKPLGNLLVNPPIDSTPLPLYRPQLVMENLDSALCQIDGMPPETPPVLCAIQGDATYQFPLTDPVAMMQNLFQNLQNEKTANENLLDLAPAFGARLGTDLYSDYLHSASRSLADVIGMAVKLFKDMTSLNFPTQMCPLDGTQAGSSASASASIPAS